jgi:two-component sensor histidine kinase
MQPASSTFSSFATKAMNFLNRMRLALMARFQSDSTLLGRAWKGLTDWLAVVTWKRLFVVSILLLILAGLFTAALEEMFYTARTSVVIDGKPASKEAANKKTKIIITADENGVRVDTLRAGESLPLPPAPPAPPKAPEAPDPPKPPASELSSGANVSISKDGIIVTPEGKDGKDQVPLFSITKDGITVKPGTEVAKTGRQIAEQARADAEQARQDAEQARQDAEQARQDAQEALRNAKVIAEGKGVQVAVNAKKDLPEDVQTLLEEITENVSGNLGDEDAPAAPKTIVNTVKPSVPAVIMNLATMMVFGLVALKVIMNTQRKAQAKVAVAQEATEREALKRQLTEARLTTMQAQVEPHFLFNTLASVDHLIETAPQRASQMQKSLIQYLRAAMPHMRETTSNMGREAQLVRSYLEILKFRMEERLEFSVDVPAGLATAEIPPMMLLSLVENAIKHGLEPKLEGGRVDMKAEIVHGKLRVTVADTGLGFNPKNSATRGTGVGLANINERLAMLYGGKAQFSVAPNQPVGTLCTIELPYRVSEQI